MKSSTLFRISALAILISVGFLGIYYLQNMQKASALDICSGSINIVQPGPTQIVGGITPVQLYGDNNIVSVKYLLDGEIIGKAKRDNANPNMWWMGWDTQYAEPGNDKELDAIVKLNGGFQCQTQKVMINIANTFQAPLEAFINPPEWQGLTNSVTFFNIDYPAGSGTGVNIPEYAVVNWSVSGRGTVTPEPLSNARYNSGPQEGEGTVRAEIYYGGQQVTLEADTQVYAQTNTSTGSGSESDNDDDSTISSDSDDLSDDDSEDEESNKSDDSNQTTTTRLQEPKYAIENAVQDSTTKSCLISKLGEDAYFRLLEENRRPRSKEFVAYYSCFEKQKYVLPSILAPVDPAEVIQKVESGRVKIKAIQNQDFTDSEEGTKKKVLVLTGNTDPNVPVILYVFSEPLVLATTSDSNGNWSYTLEDPLQEGEHEVYALVDRGDGEYEKSNVASFVVGRAEATVDNPNGYSLELVGEPIIAASNRSVNIYIAATIGIVTFAGVIVLSYGYRKILNKSTSGPVHGSIESVDNIQEPQIKDFHDSL